MKVKHFDIPDAPSCPNCGKVLDSATSIRSDGPPDPGALSVCMYCAALLQFQPALGLVRLARVPDDTDDETRRTIDKLRKFICLVQGIRS